MYSPPHENSPSSKIDNSINIAAINLALKAANAQEAPNYSQIAREFRVNRCKLSRLHRGVTQLKGVLQEWNSLLSAQQEKELIAYINKLTIRGTPPTNIIVKNIAAGMAKKQPRKNRV